MQMFERTMNIVCRAVNQLFEFLSELSTLINDLSYPREIIDQLSPFECRFNIPAKLIECI